VVDRLNVGRTSPAALGRPAASNRTEEEMGLLRLKRAAAALVAALVVVTPSAAAGRGDARLARGITAQLNAFRSAHGLTRLRVSPELTAAAERHSREMAAQGYFAHVSSDGTRFWRRIERYYPMSSTGFWSVGENLYWSAFDHTASFVVDRWYASRPHRANMEAAKWRDVGVFALRSPDAPGFYGGRDVVIVTLDFGVRR
jgi:uncharacterized protein YkwD